VGHLRRKKRLRYWWSLWRPGIQEEKVDILVVLVEAWSGTS